MDIYDTFNEIKIPENKINKWKFFAKNQNWNELIENKNKYLKEIKRRIKCKMNWKLSKINRNKCHHINYIDNRNKHINKRKNNVDHKLKKKLDNLNLENYNKLKDLNKVLSLFNKDDLEEIIEDPYFYLQEYFFTKDKLNNITLDEWLKIIDLNNLKNRRSILKTYNLNKNIIFNKKLYKNKFAKNKTENKNIITKKFENLITYQNNKIKHGHDKVNKFKINRQNILWKNEKKIKQAHEKIIIKDNFIKSNLKMSSIEKNKKIKLMKEVNYAKNEKIRLKK